MEYIIVALVALVCLLASLIIHILSFFGIDHIFVSFSLFIIGWALSVSSGMILYPSSLPPYDRSFQANHNFWRLIPKSWANILKIATIYAFANFGLTALLFNKNGLPSPYGSRVVSGFTMALFLFHFIGGWFHTPKEDKENFLALFKSKRHPRHRSGKHQE